MDDSERYKRRYDTLEMELTDFDSGDHTEGRNDADAEGERALNRELRSTR